MRCNDFGHWLIVKRLSPTTVRSITTTFSIERELCDGAKTIYTECCPVVCKLKRVSSQISRRFSSLFPTTLNLEGTTKRKGGEILRFSQNGLQ